jgi:hypothetical protein
LNFKTQRKLKEKQLKQIKKYHESLRVSKTTANLYLPILEWDGFKDTKNIPTITLFNKKQIAPKLLCVFMRKSGYCKGMRITKVSPKE